jgi:hypothetical protein
VRIETMELARIVDIDGTGGRRGVLGFAAEIAWLRECEGRYFFEHGGLPLDDGSHTCDSGTFLSAADFAIKYAKESARRYKVGRTSSLRVVVQARIVDTPVRIARGYQPVDRSGVPHLDRWEAVPQDWLLYRPEELDGYLRRGGREAMPPQRLQRIEHEWAVVWNSALEREVNAASLGLFRRRWLDACTS